MRLLALFVILLSLSVSASDVLIHGHRGARAMRPENTIPAFEYAIEAGVDFLELDLAVTKDDVLVVSHDPFVNPSLCKDVPDNVAIRQLTLEEIKRFDCGSLKNREFPKQQTEPGASIPTLGEVFALSNRGEFGFNIETKISEKHPELAPTPEQFAELLFAMISRHKLEDRVIVQSFDFRTLLAMKKLAPRIRLSALYGGKPKSFVAIAKEAGAEIVSPHYKLVTRSQVNAAHRAGLRVVPWTPNAPEEWRRLIDLGVDAIITDDPAELIAFREKLRGR